MDDFVILFDINSGLMSDDLPKVIKARSCIDACRKYLNNENLIPVRKKDADSRICVFRGSESEINGRYVKKGPKCWYKVYDRRNYE